MHIWDELFSCLPCSLHVLAEKPPWNWIFNSDTLTDWGNSRITHWRSPWWRSDDLSLSHEYISFWTDFWTARYEQTTTLWLLGSNIQMFYLVRVPACFFIAVKQVLLSILFDISVQHWTYPEIKQNENSVSAHVEQNWVFHHFIWGKQWLSLSLEDMPPRPFNFKSFNISPAFNVVTNQWRGHVAFLKHQLP